MTIRIALAPAPAYVDDATTPKSMWCSALFQLADTSAIGCIAGLRWIEPSGDGYEHIGT
jgi:hypothetical protein